MPTVTVVEWGTISPRGNQGGLGTINERFVSQEDFAYLYSIASNVNQNPRPFSVINSTLIRVENQVGVLETPSATVIEILPKTFDDDDDPIRARRLLCRLAMESVRTNPLQIDEASLALAHLPFQEWVGKRFIDEVMRLLHRGLRAGYNEIESQERFLQGRMLLSKQLKQGPAKAHLFEIAYEIFSLNRPENRLIKTALLSVARKTQWAETKRLANLAQEILDEIPFSTNIHADFARWQNTRLTADYQDVRPWCALILNEQMPFATFGQWRGMSILFQMEKLFEEAVGRRLKYAMQPGIRVEEQHQGQYLCQQNGKPLFGLRPDFMIRGRTQNWIADAKWKKISDFISNGSRFNSPYGLSQNDFYQLFAYGQKYLNGQGLMFLIYPKTKSFTKPLPIFEFNERLKLAVIPVDLEAPFVRAFDGLQVFLSDDKTLSDSENHPFRSQ